MSLIDDDNNIAVGVHGFALAADDPFSNNDDNNLVKDSNATQNESNGSNNAGDDTTANGSVNDSDDSAVNSAGAFVDNDDNKDNNINSPGAVTTDGGKFVSGAGADSNKDNTTNGGGQFSTAYGDVKDNENNENGGGQFSSADGDVKDNENNENGGGQFSSAYGDVKDNYADSYNTTDSNNDNRDQSGNNRDFDDLLDFEYADMGYNYGAIANQGVQQNMDGGGFMLNSQQNANQYNVQNGTLNDSSTWSNNADGSGGRGGDPSSSGGSGASGYEDSGASCYEACECEELAKSSSNYDDCRPKHPDPCCDDGHFGNDGNGGGGGQVGSGGNGGAGGNGFVMNFGSASASNTGGGDGGSASDGSSSGNDSVSASASPNNFWSSNLTVGANSISQDFSNLVGDIN
jgi:hypothetical protein